MKIAIELYQIIPASSGGIVPQLHNLLNRAFILFPSVDFLVYVTPRSYRPPEPLPPNVKVVLLSETNFWNELDYALVQEQAEVLFRTYPSIENPIFPASRQIALIPDLQHELLPELFSPDVLEARRRSFPTLINSAGAICVYSEYSKQVLQDHYPNSPAQIVLVPPGPSLELLQTEAVLTAQEAELIPKEPFFLYPANLWPHKNHRRLFTAFKEVLGQIPAKVILILTGDPTGWAELKAEYAELPIAHLGFVSPALLQALYRQALALAYFSLYEGFGMPLLEAFALGTPVLCSNLPVLTEVGGSAILSCDPTQPGEIAQLLLRIIKEPDLRPSLVAEGYKQVERYSGDQSSRNFVEACQLLASRPVDAKVYFQTLETSLTKLNTTRQELTEKEAAITRLNNANQERLALIEQLNTELAILKATAQERLDLIHRLDASLTELKTSAADWQAQLTRNQAEAERQQAQLTNFVAQHQALQQATQTLQSQLKEVQAEKSALQAKLEQAQTENATLVTELETASRKLSGGDPNAITGVLDNPAGTVTWQGWAIINGWAFSEAGAVIGVEVFIEETSIGSIEYGQPRPDVARVYNSINAANCGFGGTLRLPASLVPGQHQLRVRVRDEVGNQRDYYQTVSVKPERRLRRLVRARPNEPVVRRITSQIRAERHRLTHQGRRQLVYWKNRLFHYHLGILQQHPPRPWVIPAHYSRTRPPLSPPSISIITPSYNQADFLERTLRSVLDQNYPNLEYIVQDGGSKDHSAEILQRFADRLAYWESVRDKGQSNALNLGFQRSTGEIMAYLNSDDLLLPGTLNYVARYFEQHPEVDVIYGQRVIIDEHDREIGRWIVPPHDHDTPTEIDILSWADYIPQETMFWRRHIWEKVGGQIDESFQFAMDWDLILRFREAQARFVRLPRFLGAFRVHSTQKSSARIADLGNREMNRLRQRSLGRLPGEAEIHQHTLPYLRKHVFYHKLYRLGILRY